MALPPDSSAAELAAPALLGPDYFRLHKRRLTSAECRQLLSCWQVIALWWAKLTGQPFRRLRGLAAPRPLFAWVASVLFILCAVGARGAKGEEVSRQPPAGYADIAKLLTPVEDALRPRHPVETGDKDGVVLLDEELHSIDANGRRLIVTHRVERALTEAGAKRTAESLHWYRKGESTIHLLLARTVPPDGPPLPVRDDAALLHSPQDRSGDSLYDDTGELRLIFPNVKPGAVTECIVAVEEAHFRVPGEFTAAFTWGREWPRQLERRVVEMPAPLAERLQVASLGAGTPSFSKETVGDGKRIRYVWQREKILGWTPEPNRAPSEQAGPVTRLSTLPDWSGFTHWYQGLLDQRSALPPALAAQIDDWTKDAHGPRETLQTLFAKVAGEVRYTGLEFGLAALQPHDVRAVWDNQYGDCKDKANLLRAMLEHKGIAAHLTLLSTEHAGIIDRRSPGFSQFNHAIVAVELPGESGYVFCDPTIARAVPGLLSPADVDREVLVLKNGEPDWTRTPAQEVGALRYDFDLKLAADGSLAGWFSLEASGYYGAAYAERFERSGKEQNRSLLTSMVQNFYPSAEIVDAEQPKTERSETCRLRAYLVTPSLQDDPSADGANANADAGHRLTFPGMGDIAPYPGDRPTRETAYVQAADRIECNARFELPAGWAPKDLPAPYRLDAKPFRAEARWDAQPGGCRVSLVMQSRQSVVPPDQFAAFYNGARSLRAWLERPASLAARQPAASPAAPDNAAADPAALDFPMMPSGEGQLELLEKHFPVDGSAAQRRAALERTRQYFPQDKPTLFRAGVKLAALDLAANKPAAAAERIRALLQSDAANVPKETSAWGEYVLGLALEAMDRAQEAREIFVRLARDPANQDGRRARAGLEAAALLRQTDPAEAIRLLLETLDLDGDAKPRQFALLAELLLGQGRGAELDAELRKLLAARPQPTDGVFSALGETARNLLAGEHEADGRELVRLLEAAARDNDAAERMDKALADAKSWLDSSASWNLIQRNLKAYLAQHPFPADDPARPEDPPKSDRKTLGREMDAKEKDSAPDLGLRAALALLASFPPDQDFSHVLWRAAAFADWRERINPHPGDAPLLEKLFDFCELLPSNDDNRYDGQFLRAKRLERLGDVAGARRVYEKLRDDPLLPEAFRNSLYVRLGRTLELTGDLPGALDAYQRTEANAAEFSNAADAQLRAAFIRLSRNERAEAFRLFDLLAKAKPETIEKTAAADQINAMVELTRDRTKAEAYWNAMARWFPQWQEFLRENAPTLLAEDDKTVPVIPDLVELGRTAAKAARSKDQTGLWRSLGLVVHAARWQPSMAIETADLVAQGQGLFPPEILPSVRRLAIVMGENYELDDSETSRKSQVLLAANLLDGGLADKALARAQSFRQRDKAERDDWSALAMTRLWAVAVQQTGGEVNPPIAALERQLDSPKLAAADRPTAVSILAQLHTRAGRSEDEEKLLVKELENPAIKANANASQNFGARLAALRNEHSSSAQFSQAVAHWLQSHRPAWFDYAGPKDMTDPSLADADAFVRTPPPELSKAEIAKGKLLITAAETQSLERKNLAWNGALYSLLNLCQTRREAKELIDSVLAEAGFSEEIKTQAVFIAMTAGAEMLRAAEFEQWSSDPLAGKFNATQRAAIDPLRTMLDACFTKGSPAALEAASRQLLRKPLGVWENFALSQMFTRCLQMEAFTEAERLLKAFASMEMAPGTKQTRAAFQLDSIKALREARRLAPILSELRRLTLEHFPESAIPSPAALEEWRYPHALDNLPEADAQQMRLWQIKTWNWDTQNLYFWGAFIRELPPARPEQALAQRLKLAVLRLAGNDEDRLAAVDLVQQSTDSDDPELRRWLDETLRPYRDPANWPQTSAAIRMGEIRAALRAGEPIDLDAAAASVQSFPQAKRYLQRLCVEHFLQTGDAARLKVALDALSPDDLLQRSRLWITIPALELVGRSDEALLARETAKTELARALLKAESEGLIAEATLAYRLLKQVDAGPDPDPIPAHWVEGCLARIRNRRSSLHLRIDDARRRKDWSTQAALAAEAAGAYPTVYIFYFDEAEALYKLNRKQEARQPLEVYLRFSKNEQEYPQAVRWMQEIGAAASR